MCSAQWYGFPSTCSLHHSAFFCGRKQSRGSVCGRSSGGIYQTIPTTSNRCIVWHNSLSILNRGYLASLVVTVVVGVVVVVLIVVAVPSIKPTKRWIMGESSRFVAVRNKRYRQPNMAPGSSRKAMNTSLTIHRTTGAVDGTSAWNKHQLWMRLHPRHFSRNASDDVKMRLNTAMCFNQTGFCWTGSVDKKCW
jgi:hypothetical protein